MSSIEKSNNFNLEGKIKLKPPSESNSTPSSGIGRLHKGENKVALDYRKTLMGWDEEDRKKIQEGKYEGDASNWKQRVKSKYRKQFEDEAEKMPSTNKLAIIIPFRDLEKDKKRTQELNTLVSYFANYFDNNNYKIFVVEQSNDSRKFNRGQLLNIGFLYAMKEGYDNFIFHDVDLLPSEELKEYYVNTPTNEPVHIAAVWDRYNKNPDYFGGIVAFNKEMFQRINGYPNDFWGWGGEDDELYKRTRKFYNILKADKGSIRDLENLTLQQKLDYLKEKDLKFMQKIEALAKHKSTWDKNGLKSLKFKEDDITSCGKNCELIKVELSGNEQQLATKKVIDTDSPEEMFAEQDEMPKEKTSLTPQQRFNNLVKVFYNSNSYMNISHKTFNELEVRFGTKGIKQITKSDYDNVVKKMKSVGFNVKGEENGEYYLRINSEFLDAKTGRFKPSNIRTEIKGITNIQEYCKSNDIRGLPFQELVDFISKGPTTINGMRVGTVDFDDFNFRVALNTEEKIDKLGLKSYIIENWKRSKKEFRFINRVTFKNDGFPFIVDLSIVKFGNREADRFGNQNRGPIIKVYTLEESNVLNNSEMYEIEIELVNSEVGPGTKFNTPEAILESLRKLIKYVLGGLQGTNFPISYSEQKSVIESYMKMIWKEDFDASKRVKTSHFIGPNSITLQLVNIAPLDENSNYTNIRTDFVVTDKADGDRHLMFIPDNGKIYLINTSMDVIFTGAKTENKDCFNTLIDGELILHNKKGAFLNLYAAFDIYYINKVDVRNYTFMLLKEEMNTSNSRYYLLKHFVSLLSPVLITVQPNAKTKSVATLLESYKKGISSASPIIVKTKEFLPIGSKDTIFSACNSILKKEKEGRFEYTTDGLIFTHAFYGVGSSEIGKSGPKTKITWDQSFKWKPPQYNTIDFLVTTEKTALDEDIITPLFEDGINALESTQFNEYKQLVLRCGFSEKNDGFINPCQDIIDDKLPSFNQRFEERQDNDYLPKRFYPTEPYDPNAGLCKIMLKPDEAGGKQMYSEENEAFGDNTIVEFRYDFEKEEGWRWIPLRVRYDKTGKLRRGDKEYGNSYKTCNENWKSINPAGRIDENMLRTGMNIPEITVCEDKYYNTPAGKFKTQALKNFHNLYVKKMLIKSVSKPGDTLIDFACGKAGDLSKWIAAKISFVFGIDLSKDNLENRLNGSCARYLNARKINKNLPYALFVNGNSAFNVKNGEAMLNDKAKQITAAIFGHGPKEADKIGKGVARQYGKHEDGFNISSCQFAMHYFFETADTLQGFMRNLAECTKLNGYFIGTAYDGKLIFELLKKSKTGEGVQINEDGKKIWEIVKGYGSDNFDDDSSSIGYRIDVYQESINQLISEYLINFDYLDRVMDSYGFKVINREEANSLGLPEGSGLFSELFLNMVEEISKNKFKAKDYEKAPEMTSYEKKISFLNRYFVYKKYTEVNVNKVVLELSEYQEAEIQRNETETKHSVEVAKEETSKLKPKIKKLQKKLLLVAATEAVDETVPVAVVEKALKKKKEKQTETVKQKKTTVKPKPKGLIIESDSD
jgi:hypothetical protein